MRLNAIQIEKLSEPKKVVEDPDQQVEWIVDALEMLLNKFFPIFLILGVPYMIYLFVQLLIIF
ncbi:MULTISPECIES: hypothetical protein [Bacillaceae]|uniref:Uncharacterized protein n=1 Tax=Evansella alkalicola TaxID=745819 RepID=A0ABS6JTG5_9BACI|nr:MULTISPECIES: hypothetical protein [Bacillaceae]MBU9721865.1 hypothetical protein [Bacillus alkalicola]